MTRAAGVRPAQRARPFVVASVVTAVLVVLSLVVALGWRQQATDDGRAGFAADAARAQQVVARHLDEAGAVVGLGAEAAASPESTTAADFERTVAAALADTAAPLASVAVVEESADADLDDLVDRRRAAGLPELRVRSVADGPLPAALVTFEASTRGAPILQGHDLRADPVMAAALADSGAGVVRVTGRLQALPRDVVSVHPDLGASGLGLVAVAGPRTWVVGLLSGDELAAAAAAVDDELDVSLSVGADVVGASAVGDDGTAVDLGAVPAEDRSTVPVSLPGGPVVVTAADVDGPAGSGWREPALLLGAGVALAVLVGSLVLVLARGRAGALAEASAAQAARLRSEQSFQAVVQNLSDLVVVTDRAGVVTFVAPSVRRLLGREPAAVVDRVLDDLVHPDDRSLLAALAGSPGLSETGLIRARHSDGAYRSFDVVVANRVDDPAIEGLVLTGHDVTDRVEQADRLSHDATHDALTGLPNRALLRDRLAHALVRAQRSGGGVAVVFGDLDGFKEVNDRLGHLAGDELLQAVARRLRRAARAMDTVGRFAGDEFVVVCEDLDGPDAARLVAERLHRAVVGSISIGGQDVDVAMSLGVALAGSEESADSVIDRADQAMYRAKAGPSVVLAA